MLECITADIVLPIFLPFRRILRALYQGNALLFEGVGTQHNIRSIGILSMRIRQRIVITQLSGIVSLNMKLVKQLIARA